MSRPLPLLCLLLLPCLARGGEFQWWKQFPEDILERTARGVEWIPAGKDREIHTRFERLELAPAVGSRLTVFGEISFGADPNNRNANDLLRIGLLDLATPTRQDGPLAESVGEGVAFKLNPFTPPERMGTIIRLRTFADPANTNLVLGALAWKGRDTPHPGFGCAPSTAYPFVIEWERTARDAALVRLLLNDRMVEQRVTGLRFRANTFAVSRTRSSEWKSLRVEGLGVRAVDAAKK